MEYRQLNINRNHLTFWLFSLLGFFLSGVTVFFLPERFFLDTNIIIYDKFDEIGLIGSYPFTIWFYKVTGLRYVHFSIIGMLQYFILIFIFYWIGIPKYFHKISFKNCIVYFMFLIMAIYISMPSKEFLNFIFIGILVAIFKNRKIKFRRSLIISICLLLFFAYFFRPYYTFIAILTIGMYYGSKLKFPNKRILSVILGLVILIMLSVSYGVVKGTFISEKTRYTLNQVRIGNENANSMILSPIPPDTWYGESFGIVYGFFSVNLPFNGIKHLFSPHILLFVIWQLLLFLILFKRFGKCFKEGRNDNYELWLFFILFSFFIVQGIFEPDLGSAIRHKAGVFPLIYYLLYYEDFRRSLR